MPVMTEEQFLYLEAMIIAMVNSHIQVHKAAYHNEHGNEYTRRNQALEATDYEHTVRKAAKEALTK